MCRDTFLILLLVSFAIWIIHVNYSKGITYYIHDSPMDKEFKQITSEILKNSGWKKYKDIEETDTPDDAVIQVSLVADSDLQQYHDGKQEYYDDKTPIRFSITTQNIDKKPQCFINYKNWAAGVKQSGLTRDQYRQYVIEHEFGHGLGYHHQECNERTAPNGVCPVMYQSTRGCRAPFRCGYEVSPFDTENLIDRRYIR